MLATRARSASRSGSIALLLDRQGVDALSHMCFIFARLIALVHSSPALRDDDSAAWGPPVPLEPDAEMWYRTYVLYKWDVVAMRSGDREVRQAELFPTSAYRVRHLPGERPFHRTLWQLDLDGRPRVELHYSLATVSTWYDLLQSTIAPPELLETAQRLHLDAIGVVDQATTLGHVPLARAARATSIHLVYGTTLIMADGHPLRLLARTEEGYRNLARLVSTQASGLSRLPWETLQTYNRGLYLLCGGRRGRLWHDLLAGDERILWTLARPQPLPDRENHFSTEVQQDETDGLLERRTLQRLLALVEQAGERAIATHDIRVLRPTDASRHRLVSAIDHQLSFWAEDARLPVWRAREPSRYALPTAA